MPVATHTFEAQSQLLPLQVDITDIIAHKVGVRTRQCYARPMATELGRILVTADPELSRALREASRKLPGLSESALVRELAIRGARTLPENPAQGRIQRLIERTGARPPRGNIQEYLRSRDDLDDAVATSGPSSGEILDELREDKI